MSRPHLTFAMAILTLFPAGCGRGSSHPDDSGSDSDIAGDADADHDSDTDDDWDVDTDGDEDGTLPSCPRSPAAPDRTRYVVISHPYDESGDPAGVFEVLALSEAGELNPTGQTFEMGRSIDGAIAFTPDGEVGLAVQEDGTLGVFLLDNDGVPEVVEPAFDGVPYATNVIPGPTGDQFWVLDGNWRNNGGGIYSVRLDCDGVPSAEGMVAPSKLPYGLARLGGDRYLLAARDVGDVIPEVADSFLLDLNDSASVVTNVSAFGDDEAIVASVTATADRRYVLIGDNNSFSGIPNRVAVVRVEGDILEPVQVLTPLEDPVAIVTSPFDNATLVVSGFGNAIFSLSYDPSNAAAPFSVRGQLTYEGHRPALPFGAVPILAGSLTGLVLVAENLGVRRVRFEHDGTVTDLGPHDLGEGYEAIVGSIGVQP